MKDKLHAKSTGVSPSGSSLMAVLFADLVGYSLQVSRSEAETLKFMDQCFEMFRSQCKHFRGELVKTTGDGVVVVFPSGTSAVEYAVEIHRNIHQMQIGNDHSLKFRIGIHVGEIHRKDGDVFGHAVNVAARLEPLADAGGICVSHDVYEHAHRTTDFGFEFLGKRKLKNIPALIPLYRVVADREIEGINSFDEALDIETIDGLRVVGPQGTITLPRSKRSKAVLGYLALSPDHRESMGRLSAVLLPDSPALSARQAVRRAVRSLHERLGDIVESTDELLLMDGTAARVDLEHLEAQILRGTLDPILRRDSSWIDYVLTGLEDISPVYSAWLAVTRTEWLNNIAAALETSLDRFTDPSEHGVRSFSEALLNIEPCHERAARMLIAHHLVGGNRGAAMRVFDALKSQLDERFGIAPHHTTVMTLQGRGIELPDKEKRISTQPLRLQVRQFEARSDSAVQYVDGFRNEMMAGLSCFRGWSVVEGAQVADEDRRPFDYALFGEQLESDSDSKITVALRLVEVESERLVWSQSFDLGVGKVSSAWHQATGKVAATLEIYISNDRASSKRRRSTDDVIDLWLRGERLITGWTPESHGEAAAIFEDLTERAPDFAPAFASLASILNVRHVVEPGSPRDATSVRRSHKLAEKAVELDPLDARNQLAMAWSASLEDRFGKASVHMDMAARLNPHSPRTLMSCAMGFAFFGQSARAMEILEHCLDCAPILLEYQWAYAAAVYFLAGDDEKAVDAAVRSGDKIVDNPGWHAAALSRLGRGDEASERLEKLFQDVSAVWVGDSPPSRSDVIDWFVDAYPLSNDVDRMKLRSTLGDLPTKGG